MWGELEFDQVNKPLLSTEPISPAKDAEMRLPLRVVERPKQEPELPKTSTRRWPWKWLVFLLAIFGFGCAVYLNYPAIKSLVQQRTADPTPMASALVPKEILGLGKLRPADNVIAIAPPYGAGDARIAEIKATEGDTLQKGDVIAVLDSAPSLQSAVEAARANLEVQRAVVEQTKFASSASRDEAVASLDSAKSAVEVAKLDYDRTATLYRKGIAAKASYDQKQSTYEQARRAVDRAQATLSRYDEQKLNGRQDVIVAEMRVSASEAELKRAEQDMEKAFIRAPATGTILSLDNRVGEKPAQNGIATMADLTRMIAEVEIYQSNIGPVALGQNVTLKTDALKEPFTGTVSFIGLEVKKQTAIDADPAANTDARVIKVYVALDPPSTERARAFTNLQVTAHIKVDPAP
jgi:HlyD family secretion protein